MCTVLLPPGVNQVAVNKYIRVYHITSYIISYILSYHILYPYHIIFKIWGISWLSVLGTCSKCLFLSHNVPTEKPWKCYQATAVVILLYCMRM